MLHGEWSTLKKAIRVHWFTFDKFPESPLLYLDAQCGDISALVFNRENATNLRFMLITRIPNLNLCKLSFLSALTGVYMDTTVTVCWAQAFRNGGRTLNHP